MISHLSINGLGIIAAADLDLHPGLVVFTGETGAGKTMLVSALGLVLGDRFDTSLLAESGTKVQAALHLPATALSLTRLREAGGDVPEPAGSADTGSAAAGTATVDVIVGRHIPPSGRGRAIAGGATVPVSVLADLGADVASRHAQSDQIALRNARTQRRALDRFGGPTVAGALARYRDSYSTFLRLSRELAERTTADRDRAQRVATLREELTVIDAVDPASGEDESLTTAIARLANAEALRDDLATAGSLLSDDESGAVTMVAGAVAALQHARGTDPAAGELADRLLLLQDQLGDAASDVRGLVGELAADPEQLAQLHARKAALTPLLRRFGPTAADVVRHAADARSQLADLQGNDEAIAALRAQVADNLAELADLADALSAARREAAGRLAARVTDELHGLAMPTATFSVTVDRRSDPGGLGLPDGSTVAFGDNGIDVVRFGLASHAGATAVPLGDGASGGELSRIMLALEVVLAESSPPGVFIFDEVDAGIGGRTAVEVGRRLARLARHSQVLVVTHLPQVASFADQHLVVRKAADGTVTATSVVEVSGDDRVAELSRMLSGQDTSQAALAHAHELLDLAAQEAQA